MEAEFKRLKAERDRFKAEFDRLSSDHKRAREAFQKRLEQVKATKREKEQTAVQKVNKAIVKVKKPFSKGTIFGENAKIIERKDGSGKTDVYFSGLDPNGDGIGHGHAVIDRDGNVTYLRDAWTLDHKDYLIDVRRDPTHK